MDPPLQGPLRVEMVFYRRRPKDHYTTKGELKDSAPVFPETRPDALKLCRAVEDALTGICWKDDAQIVTQINTKRYGEPERAVIVIREERA